MIHKSDPSTPCSYRQDCVCYLLPFPDVSLVLIEEGKVYYWYKLKMDMTKAALMGLGSKVEGGKFRENDFSIMPPPPSPAWRRVATPKRESSVQKSPQSSYSDLFPDENLTECQAVPSHLFSPMRQAERAKDLLRYPLAMEGVSAPVGHVCLAHAMQKVSNIVGLRPYG